MNNNRNNTGAAGGIGFFGLLTIAFIVLKLTGVIDWSWLWVLAPVWIPTAVVIAILLIVLVVVLVKALTEQAEESKRIADRHKSIDAEAHKYGLERLPDESDPDLKRRIAFFKQNARRARHE